ncbi:metallophosphoesterase [Myxococcus sp. K38C18041901]|uniref:metallophosphoesterase n=1 Tax=Myxococcus guangdongensis TaxID=2906760 RepID=UPI0020A767BB|nr:metallophosphoesterase [Myxococcus guangdongensis]MCP3063045.1 metallophosphoesterase [Myxococcus guangdongensis]
MRLFGIGDTHLPSTRNKDMERFGWMEHPRPLQRAWDEKVRPEDIVIVAGDISWATRPHEVMDDLKWLDERPGRKLLVRGNHDYWWGDSASKLRKLLEPFKTLEAFLHNSAAVMGPWVIAGTRLWTAPEAPPMPGGEMGDEPIDQGYVERETRRLATSIEDAKKKEAASPTPLVRVAAVHFPPLYANEKATAFSDPIEAFKPKVCVYGHLHSTGIPAGFTGERAGVRYVLASCDAAGFSPMLLDEV